MTALVINGRSSGKPAVEFFSKDPLQIKYLDARLMQDNFCKIGKGYSVV